MEVKHTLAQRQIQATSSVPAQLTSWTSLRPSSPRSQALPGARLWQVPLQTRDTESSGPFSHICGAILLVALHYDVTEVQKQTLS